MTDALNPESCAAASPSALLDELGLYGWRPFEGEPDPRPLPDEERAAGAVADMADALVATLVDTRHEPDLDDLLWALANLFHRAIDRIGRLLDDNEDAQREAQREQDGSEVASVALERLLAEGLTLVERRNAMTFFRDCAAAQFKLHLGKPWSPRSGSMIHRRTLTASLIDSRDFLAARARAERAPLMPAGTRVAFAGGQDCNDHARIWTALDKARARHPDMVLLHGGGGKGAERIAACWADAREVTQIVFRPEWDRHGKAAPFKRNDQLLDTLPVGLIAFPGSGITANLVDKARKMGIPLWRHG